LRRPRCAWLLAALAALGLAVGGCSSTTVGVEVYGGVGYYDDPWYWGGCCVDPPPAGIGPPPPRPTHPIAAPPRPAQPIARPLPAPRPAAMPRGRR
jgi:hypothetical protein